MSLSISTAAASGDSAMMRLVKALKPLGDRVLVRHLGLSSSSLPLSFFPCLMAPVLTWRLPPAEQKTTKQVGSIVLPDSATEKIHQGVVVEVGPGARNPFVSHSPAPAPICFFFLSHS